MHSPVITHSVQYRYSRSSAPLPAVNSSDALVTRGDALPAVNSSDALVTRGDALPAGSATEPLSR